jgi:hypothetical protein
MKTEEPHGRKNRQPSDGAPKPCALDSVEVPTTQKRDYPQYQLLMRSSAT